MKIALFYHSLISDWNHGNAHFLRGIATELIRRGHQVTVFEPCDSWSATHLISEYGQSPVEQFHSYYPELSSIRYERKEELLTAIQEADLAIVHEWNPPELVGWIGQQRRRGVLLFHDTHHRAASCPDEMSAYRLSQYDGVLAFGSVIRDIYLQQGWARNAWTWHEAADISHFHPLPRNEISGDLVWIGNWGDDERTAELEEFLFGPVERLGLQARVYGVRYPDQALRRLKQAGIAYGGWLPNFRVPEIFSKFKVTVHVPRRPYATVLPGIPTIRPFEAMACRIPLVSAPWNDSEQMFTAGADYLLARDGHEMEACLSMILDHPDTASNLAGHALDTIQKRHTCAHRVDELLNIYREISGIYA